MNQAETQMNNLRTNSIYALIVLSFATAIAIIEFIHFDNQIWHDIACRFLFPLLALLIPLSIAAFIFAPCISKQGQQSSRNIFAEDNTQTKDSAPNTQDAAKQDTSECQQDKHSGKQTTPTAPDTPVNYRTTSTEITFSSTETTYQTTNDTAKDTEQRDAEEQAS